MGIMALLACPGGDGLVLHSKLWLFNIVNPPKGTAMNQSSTGLPDNIAKCLAYVFGWISGLAIFFIEKQDHSVRFHGAQSTVLFGSLSVLNIFLPIIPALGPLIMVVLAPVSLILWLVLMVMSLVGNAPRLPVIANFADQLLAKSNNSGDDVDPSEKINNQ